MTSEQTIRRELTKLHTGLLGDHDERTQRELYGGMQALEWALDRDAAAISTFVSPALSPESEKQ